MTIHLPEALFVVTSGTKAADLDRAERIVVLEYSITCTVVELSIRVPESASIALTVWPGSKCEGWL